MATLVTLGLSVDEARVYLALLEGPLSGDVIARQMRMTQPRARAVLRSLTQRACVLRFPGKVNRFSAVSPEAAFPRLIREREDSTDECRRVVQDLARRHHLYAGPEARQEYIEVVVGIEAVRNQLHAEQAEAKTEILSFIKGPVLTMENPGAAESLDRGIVNRTLWERPLIEEPNMLEEAHRWAALGEQIRVVPSLPAKLLIIDRTKAVINVREPMAGGPAVAGFLTRHPELVETFYRLFELLWASGIPLLELGDDAEREEEGLILQCLAAGMKDAAIARRLGVSERTLSRRITDLLARLGVETRFQAGYVVARQGDAALSGSGHGTRSP